MGKSQAMYREHVVNSDEFLGLTIEAQCFYFHASFDADNIGELAGVRRLARGYGFGADELEELRDAGYLLEVDGRWFVTHYFVNNSKPKNERMLAAAERSWQSRPPALQFVGERFNSSYAVSLTSGERVTIDSALLARNCNGNGTGNGNGNCKVDATPSNVNAVGGVGVSGGGEPAFPYCPACGQLHDLEGEEGMERMRCPETGRTYWLEDSEWR